MTSSPVIVMVLEGKDAINIARKMMGKTFGSQAEPGTIRGDFGVSNSFNLIHGSDSPESAQRELGLFFKPATPAPPPPAQVVVTDGGGGPNPVQAKLLLEAYLAMAQAGALSDEELAAILITEGLL